jgi:hypothetical protein
MARLEIAHLKNAYVPARSTPTAAIPLSVADYARELSQQRTLRNEKLGGNAKPNSGFECHHEQVYSAR